MGDGTVRVWSAEAALPIEQGAPLSSMASNADGSLVATGGGDGTIRLWFPSPGSRGASR